MDRPAFIALIIHRHLAGLPCPGRVHRMPLSRPSSPISVSASMLLTDRPCPTLIASSSRFVRTAAAFVPPIGTSTG